jgi:hypothetical protein
MLNVTQKLDGTFIPMWMIVVSVQKANNAAGHKLRVSFLSRKETYES